MMLPLVIGVLALQAPQRIPDEPVCPSCRIALREVAVLGRTGDEIPSDPWVVQRDLRGRFYLITPEASPSVPLAYDAAGQFLGEIGRTGRGPREFRSPRLILIGPDDSLFVFDGANARLSVLDATWTEVRTVPMPQYPNSAVRFDNGDFIMNLNIRDREGRWMAYHRFDAEGNLLGAFGDEPGEPLPRGDYTSRVRWLTAGPGSTFWSVRPSRRYVVEQWDATGRRVQRLERDAEWYRPYERERNVTPDSPPQPWSTGLWYDATTGLLWTLMVVGDSRWRDALGAPVRMEGQMAYPNRDKQRVFDTIIEVLDPRTGRVMARQRFDETVDMAVGDGLFAGIREREDGAPYVVVWRATIQH